MSEVASRKPGSRSEDWIALQFRRVYDDALQDSIPEEMLDLLNELDEKEGASRGDDDRGEGGNA